MAIKMYTIFPKNPGLELHYKMQVSIMPMILTFSTTANHSYACDLAKLKNTLLYAFTGTLETILVSL